MHAKLVHRQALGGDSVETSGTTSLHCPCEHQAQTHATIAGPLPPPRRCTTAGTPQIVMSVVAIPRAVPLLLSYLLISWPVRLGGGCSVSMSHAHLLTAQFAHPGKNDCESGFKSDVCGFGGGQGWVAGSRATYHVTNDPTFMFQCNPPP